MILCPHHTKLVLSTFLKMLPNGLKLCANGVDVVATYELHGRARTGSMLQNFEPAQNFLAASRSASGRSDNVFKTRWTYYERNCRTSIVLGTCYDVVQSGINCSTCAHRPGAFVPRSSRSTQLDRITLASRYSVQIIPTDCGRDKDEMDVLRTVYERTSIVF